MGQCSVAEVPFDWSQGISRRTSELNMLGDDSKIADTTCNGAELGTGLMGEEL